jgi:hypothetical protein
MKKTLLFILSFTTFLAATAQEKTSKQYEKIAKWAPAGLYLGHLNLIGEGAINSRNSITAQGSFPIKTKKTFQYEDKDADVSMEIMSFHFGYRHYLSRKKFMKGFYLEPYAKYLKHESEGIGSATLDTRLAQMRFNNDFRSIGAGVQLGVQFLIARRVAIDFYFLGPEISTGKDHFNAVEISNIIPWTHLEAAEAERSIRELLDDVPFIGDRTTVTVDRANKSVSADFKGFLPGIRTGISIGLAF